MPLRSNHHIRNSINLSRLTQDEVELSQLRVPHFLIQSIAFDIHLALKASVVKLLTNLKAIKKKESINDHAHAIQRS